MVALVLAEVVSAVEATTIFAALVLVQGLGSAIAFASAPLLIVEVAPADRTSEATGVAIAVRHVFNAIESQVMAVPLATATVSDSAAGPGSYPAPQAFALTLGAITGLSLVGLAITLALPRLRMATDPVPGRLLNESA
jgi:hypothetical protein